MSQQRVPTINALIVASLIINTLLSYYFLAEFSAMRPYSESFVQVMRIILGGFIVTSVVGIVLMQTSSFKLGSILAFIGFAVFVPIGFIGVFGVRKILDERARIEAGII